MDISNLKVDGHSNTFCSSFEMFELHLWSFSKECHEVVEEQEKAERERLQVHPIPQLLYILLLCSMHRICGLGWTSTISFAFRIAQHYTLIFILSECQSNDLEWRVCDTNASLKIFIFVFSDYPTPHNIQILFRFLWSLIWIIGFQVIQIFGGYIYTY